MDKKDKPLEGFIDINKGFSNLDKSNNNDWFTALILISSLFGSGFGSGENKYNDLDKRLAKLEAKQEIIEDIILK